MSVSSVVSGEGSVVSGVSLGSGDSGSSGASGSSVSSLLLEEQNTTVERLKSRVILFFAYLGNRPLPVGLAVFCVVVELIQLWGFTFTGPLVRAWDTADDHFFSYVAEVRTFGAASISYNLHFALLWIIAALLAVVIIVALRVVQLVYRGEEAWGRPAKLAQYAATILPAVLYLPIMSYALSFLNCGLNGRLAWYTDQTCTEAIGGVGMTVAAICVLTAFVCTAICSALNFPCFAGRREYFSTVDGRLRMLLFAAKTVTVVLLEVSVVMPGTPTLFAYGIGQAICWLALLVWIGYFLPFHRFATNIVYACAFGGGLATCLARLAVVVDGNAGLIGLFIGLGAALAAAGVAGLVVYGRLRLLSGRRLVPHAGVEFDQEFEVEIATRFALGSDEDKVIDAAVSLYIAGAQRFPHSIPVRLAQCLFMVTHFEDHRMLQIYVQRIRRLKPNIEQMYLLFRIDWHRRCLVREQDGGEEEIAVRLNRAAKYERECKRWMRGFWRHLANDEELGRLPDIVSALERNERMADDIFQKLLVQFPKSTRALRAYGIFLEEVKNDVEAGQMCFRMADEIEQDKERHRRSKREKEEKKVLRRNKGDTAKESKGDKKKASKKNKVGHGNSTTALALKPAGDESSAAADDALKSDKPVRRARFEVSDSDSEAATRDNYFELDEDIDLKEKETAWLSAGGASESPSVPDLDTAVTALVDTKSDPRLHPNQRHRRAEAQRIRIYSRKIDQSKSNALRALSIAVRATLLVLLVDILIIYISSKSMFDNFATSISTLTKAGRLTDFTHQAAFSARRLDLALYLNNSNMYDYTRIGMADTARSFKTMLLDLRDDDFSANVNHVWDEPSTIRKKFIRPRRAGTAGTFQIYVDTLFNLAQAFSDASIYVAETGISYTTNLTDEPDFRTIMDNFDALVTSFQATRTVYMENSSKSADTLRTTLYILLPISVCALLALALAVFRPTLNRIANERAESLKLFSAVPKASIAKVRDKVSGAKGNDDIVDHEEELQEEMATADDIDIGSTSTPLLRQLSFRYFGTLIAAALLVAVCFFLGLYFAETVSQYGPEIAQSLRRKSLTKRVQLLAGETIFTDQYTWPDGLPAIKDNLNVTLYNLTVCHDGLKFGSPDLGLPSGLSSNVAQNYVLYRKPCHELDSDTKCAGMERMMQELISNGYEQLYINASDLEPPVDRIMSNYPNLENMLYLLGIDTVDATKAQTVVNVSDATTWGELSAFLLESAALFQAEAVGAMTSIDTAMLIVFIVCLPFLMIAYFVLAPLETRIRSENGRTMKMLLMVPLDVIDSVPALREYLDTGKHENAQQKLRNAYDEYVARTEAILSANVDGIIAINEQKIITMVNPAAETIFGWTKEELEGKNVKVLCPQEVAELHDAFVDRYIASRESRRMGKVVQQMGRRKDGSAVPLQMMLSSTAINDKLSFVAFLRDISEQKEGERLLKREKEKTEKLLVSLLPAVIAEQLKEDGIDGSKHMVAEAYKEVTILFADIVSFTTMSSKITPSELVFMLNQLFSEWDALCEKHGVEKIKTIGDCYMAAAGVPQRCVDHASRMIEFGLDMLGVLKTFNETHNKTLNLRIGINTGPVVAGVLGTKKITFDLWGDAVNVASRMESSGVPGRIQVSHATFEQLQGDHLFEERGRMEIKGKGQMLTYLYKDRRMIHTASGHFIRRATLTPPPNMTAFAAAVALNTSSVAESPAAVKTSASLEHDAAHDPADELAAAAAANRRKSISAIALQQQQHERQQDFVTDEELHFAESMLLADKK